MRDLCWGDLVMFAICWLGIGIAFVVAETPAFFRDQALRGYLNRTGRLPHRLVGEIAVVWGVVAWPVTFVRLAGRQ